MFFDDVVGYVVELMGLDGKIVYLVFGYIDFVYFKVVLKKIGKVIFRVCVVGYDG